MYNKTIEQFNEITKNLWEKERSLLDLAYHFTENAHQWQLRKTWEPYFYHPIQTSINLWEKFKDIPLMLAWLLHDTVEDNPDISIEDIYAEFWSEVGFLVDSVTKNTPRLYKNPQKFEKKIDKFLYAGFQDIRCYLLKLADRADNIKTIQNLKDNKQVRMAFETQAIFTPLEHLLNYKNIMSIQEAKDNFHTLIQENNIQNFSELKNFLTRQTFQNFSNECFDAVYRNSGNVAWKINDKKMLNNLLEIHNINEKIEVLSIESNAFDDFAFTFQFKKWQIMNNSIKLEIWNTYSF